MKRRDMETTAGRPADVCEQDGEWVPEAASAPMLRAEGEPCTLSRCPPGLFLFRGHVCVKTEYERGDHYSEAFWGSTGEAFWGGAKTSRECENLVVQPLTQKGGGA